MGRAKRRGPDRRQRGGAVVPVLVLIALALLVVAGVRVFGESVSEKYRCHGDAVASVGGGGGGCDDGAALALAAPPSGEPTSANAPATGSTTAASTTAPTSTPSAPPPQPSSAPPTDSDDVPPSDGQDVGLDDYEELLRELEGGGGFTLRDGASIGVGFIPLVGSGQSVVELITGQDYIAGEPTSRWMAAVGIVAGIVPGGKGVLKAGAKGTKVVKGGSRARRVMRGFVPPAGTRVIPKGIPKGWRVRPTKGDGGVWFFDPKNPGNAVRVMPGNPKSPFPNSRKPYVRWQKNGQALDGNGKVVSKNTPDAHIPLEDFRFNPDLFK